MLKDNSKRLPCSITKERDFYAKSQKKETSLNNYKVLKRVLNTWYTIRGIHNTMQTEQTLFF